MTDIRKLVYAYLELPWHRKIMLWKKIGWPDSKPTERTIQEENVAFFRWVSDNKKVDELENRLK